MIDGAAAASENEPSRSRGRREPALLQGDEAELFARDHARLLRVTAMNVTTSPDNIDEACAYAWSQLLDLPAAAPIRVRVAAHGRPPRSSPPRNRRSCGASAR